MALFDGGEKREEEETWVLAAEEIGLFTFSSLTILCSVSVLSRSVVSKFLEDWIVLLPFRCGFALRNDEHQRVVI